MSPIQINGISHILLDIEGTTCPISFVSDTLFPYARRALPQFLAAHAQRQDVSDLLAQLNRIWAEDRSEPAQRLRHAADAPADRKANGNGASPEWRVLVPFIELLIERDQKLTPLKDLQGMIWDEGYGSGDLVGPLFEDVAAALRRWRSMGLELASYSSGSIAAQKLIYKHSNAGDLSGLFGAWFDTHIGLKQEQESYLKLAAAMQASPGRILFISDSYGELLAAETAGLQCLCSRRPANSLDARLGAFRMIENFNQIALV